MKMRAAAAASPPENGAAEEAADTYPGESGAAGKTQAPSSHASATPGKAQAPSSDASATPGKAPSPAQEAPYQEVGDAAKAPGGILGNAHRRSLRKEGAKYRSVSRNSGSSVTTIEAARYSPRAAKRTKFPNRGRSGYVRRNSISSS